MIPYDYNFYVGKADTGLYFTAGVGINSDGEFIQQANAYSYGTKPIEEGHCLYIDIKTRRSTDKIFFYDENDNFISSNILYTYYTQPFLFIPPAGAKRWAIVFTNDDENFMAKKDEKFIYQIKAVKPHYKDLTKKYKKESGQEFFRASLEGKIQLFGDDYELVKNSDIEDRLLLFILRNRYTAVQEWKEHYRGEFSKTDCKFDNVKKRCEIKTTTVDEYNDILNKYDDKYDLIKLAPAISKINLHKRSLMQVYIRGSNSITNFFGGTYWENDVNEAIDDHLALVGHYCFSYIKTFNEIDITNAPYPEAIGVYAGGNGSWEMRNSNNGIYRLEFVKVISINDPLTSAVPTVYNIADDSSGRNAKISSGKYNENLYRLHLIRDSDSAILGESARLYFFESGYSSNSVYIGRSSIAILYSSMAAAINTIFAYHIYRRLLCDVDAIDSIPTYDLPADDFVSDNRNYKKCIGLQGGSFYCTTRTVDEPTRYGVNDFGKYFTNRFIPGSAGLGRALPVSRSSWANASLWYTYDVSYPIEEAKLRKKYTLKDSYAIADVIKALLNKIAPGIKHEATVEYSDFLYGQNNVIKYNNFKVYITQKTNILKGDYDQAAQKAEISFGELMKMLSSCFKCYWFIEDGKFKIEHLKYFTNGGSYSGSPVIQIDFTGLIDQFNKLPVSQYQSDVDYDKSELNRRYEFKWMDDVTDLFGGVTIDVQSNYIQKDKTEEINPNMFSSDVDYMMFNPSNFSDDGFALLCPIVNNGELELPIIMASLKDNDGDSYSAYVQNWYGSWSYLARFYMYDMPANRIKCNTVNLIAGDVKLCMNQSIEFISEYDIDDKELIKTEIGNGKIEEYSVSFNSRLAKVKLSYRPE